MDTQIDGPVYWGGDAPDTGEDEDAWRDEPADDNEDSDTGDRGRQGMGAEVRERFQVMLHDVGYVVWDGVAGVVVQAFGSFGSYDRCLAVVREENARVAGVRGRS